MASNDPYLRSDTDKSETSPDSDVRLRSDADKSAGGGGGGGSIKVISGVAFASIKIISGVAIANVKKVSGIAAASVLKPFLGGIRIVYNMLKYLYVSEDNSFRKV